METTIYILSLTFGYFIAIFAIMNPIMAVPVFLVLTDNNTEEHRRKMANKASMYAFFILIAFLYGGTYIINFFGLSLEGIRIAGGLMIMSWAFSLLNPETGGRKPSQEDEDDARDKADISFSPMAMPLLSGPGSIAVVIGFASQDLTVTNYIMITVAIFFLRTRRICSTSYCPTDQQIPREKRHGRLRPNDGFHRTGHRCTVYHQRHYAHPGGQLSD